MRIHSRTGSSSLKKMTLTAVLLLIGLSMVFPFFFMLSSSLKPNSQVFGFPIQLIPSSLYLDNYETLFANGDFFIWYGNTVRMVALLIAFRFLVVTQAAYAFARLSFKWKNAIFMLFISTIMIPWDTTILARYLLYDWLGLIDTHWALIIPGMFDVLFLFLVRQFFTTVPFELSEAAIIDGCGHWKIYWKVILPLSKPVLLTLVIFTFIWSWNDFTGPFIFINTMSKQMLSVGLVTFQTIAGTNYALQMAGSCLGIIPAVIVFIWAQKYFIQGISTTGIKG